MLFSAIAMIAFTISANAANEVVESVEVVTTSNTPCASSYNSNVAILKSIGYSDDAAKSIALSMFFACLEAVHGKLPNTLEPSSSSNTVQTS